MRNIRYFIACIIVLMAQIVAAEDTIKMKPGDQLTASSSGNSKSINTVNAAREPWPISGGACYVPPPIPWGEPRSFNDLEFRGSVRANELAITGTFDVPNSVVVETAVAVTMEAGVDFGDRVTVGKINGEAVPLNGLSGVGSLLGAKLDEGAGGMEYNTYAEHFSEKRVRRTAYYLYKHPESLPFQNESKMYVNSEDSSSWNTKVRFYDISDMNTGQDAGQTLETALPILPGQVIKGHLGSVSEDYDYYRIMADLQIGDEVEITIIDTDMPFYRDGNPLFTLDFMGTYCEENVATFHGGYPGMSQRTEEPGSLVKRYVVTSNSPHYIVLDRDFGAIYDYEIMVNVKKGENRFADLKIEVAPNTENSDKIAFTVENIGPAEAIKTQLSVSSIDNAAYSLQICQGGECQPCDTDYVNPQTQREGCLIDDLALGESRSFELVPDETPPGIAKPVPLTCSVDEKREWTLEVFSEIEDNDYDNNIEDFVQDIWADTELSFVDANTGADIEQITTGQKFKLRAVFEETGCGRRVTSSLWAKLANAENGEEGMVELNVASDDGKIFESEAMAPEMISVDSRNGYIETDLKILTDYSGYLLSEGNEIIASRGGESDNLLYEASEQKAQIRLAALSAEGINLNERIISNGQEYEIILSLEEGHPLREKQQVDVTMINVEVDWEGEVPGDWDSWIGNGTFYTRTIETLNRVEPGIYTSGYRTLEALPYGREEISTVALVAVFPDAEISSTQEYRSPSSLMINTDNALLVSTSLAPLILTSDVPGQWKKASGDVFVGDNIFILANNQPDDVRAVNINTTTDYLLNLPMKSLSNGDYFQLNSNMRSLYTHISPLISIDRLTLITRPDQNELMKVNIGDSIRVIQSSGENKFLSPQQYSTELEVATNIKIDQMKFVAIPDDGTLAENLLGGGYPWIGIGRRAAITDDAIIESSIDMPVAVAVELTADSDYQERVLPDTVDAQISVYRNGELIKNNIPHVLRRRQTEIDRQTVYTSDVSYYLNAVSRDYEIQVGDTVNALLSAPWLSDEQNIVLNVLPVTERLIDLKMIASLGEDEAGPLPTNTIYIDGVFRAEMNFGQAPMSDLASIDVRAWREDGEAMSTRIYARKSAEDENTYISENIDLLLDDRFRGLRAGDMLQSRYGEEWEWEDGNPLVVTGRNLAVDSISFLDAASGSPMEEAPVGSEVIVEVTFEALEQDTAIPQIVLETAGPSIRENGLLSEAQKTRIKLTLEPTAEAENMYVTKVISLTSEDNSADALSVQPDFGVVARVMNSEANLAITEGVLDETKGRLEVNVTDSFGHEVNYPVAAIDGSKRYDLWANRTVDMEPGQYDVVVMGPIRYSQVVTIEAGDELCMSRPATMGRVKTIKSASPGMEEPLPGILFRNWKISGANTWCGEGTAPGNWAQGRWLNDPVETDGVRVTELPAGKYEFDTKMWLEDGKAKGQVDVIAGELSELVIREGQVLVTINDNANAKLPADIRFNDEEIINGEPTQIAIGSGLLSAQIGSAEYTKSVTISHGGLIEENIQTGRVIFVDQLPGASPTKIALRSLMPQIQLSTDINAGEELQLPQGFYRYEYPELRNQQPGSFRVYSGGDIEIQTPVKGGLLVLNIPQIVRNYYTRDLSAKLMIYDARGRAIKSENCYSTTCEAYLPPGNYSAHFIGNGEDAAYLNSGRFYVEVAAGENSPVDIPLGQLRVVAAAKTEGKEMTYKIAMGDIQSFASLDNGYVNTYFLGPGTYRITDNSNPKRSWTKPVSVGRTASINIPLEKL